MRPARFCEPGLNEDPMNLAIFLPNWIGDAVMATPAIRALRSLGPKKVVGVCRRYVADVVEGSGWFDKLLFLDRGGPLTPRWPGGGWKLAREKIGMAVLFPNSFRVGLVARLAGCGRRVGFRRYLRGWLLSDALAPVRDAAGKLAPAPIVD